MLRTLQPDGIYPIGADNTRHTHVNSVHQIALHHLLSVLALASDLWYFDVRLHHTNQMARRQWGFLSSTTICWENIVPSFAWIYLLGRQGVEYLSGPHSI